MPETTNTDTAQNYRIEIRFDVWGSEAEARAAADKAAEAIGGEITAIFDEQFDELDVDAGVAAAATLSPAALVDAANEAVALNDDHS
jgi:hypothetical protein